MAGNQSAYRKRPVQKQQSVSNKRYGVCPGKYSTKDRSEENTEKTSAGDTAETDCSQKKTGESIAG